MWGGVKKKLMEEEHTKAAAEAGGDGCFCKQLDGGSLERTNWGSLV